MKSRETLIRLKKFQVDEKRRRVTQIEGMIADFQRMSVDLEREIQTEQERAGINDPSHFAYPTYAKAAIQRTLGRLPRGEYVWSLPPQWSAPRSVIDPYGVAQVTPRPPAGRHRLHVRTRCHVQRIWPDILRVVTSRSPLPRRLNCPPPTTADKHCLL
jgi:hypothetical protein